MDLMDFCKISRMLYLQDISFVVEDCYDDGSNSIYDVIKEKVNGPSCMDTIYHDFTCS